MNASTLLAAMNSNDLAATIITGLLCMGCFGVLLVRMMIRHQQEMAKLIRQDRLVENVDTSQDLRAEVAQLRALVQQQMIMLDDLRQKQSAPELQERVG